MRVFENISLREFNSFGVEAHARQLVEWRSVDDLRAFFANTTGESTRHCEVRTQSEQGGSDENTSMSTERWMALGGGNNMLFVSDFNGTLIKSVARGITITGETDSSIAVRAEAGVDWGDFVAWCIDHNAWGAENLSAIPGTVGAAPIQNIGAYGAEVKDIITSVECFVVPGSTASPSLREGTHPSQGGEFQELILDAAHCDFGYRDSVFKRSLRGRVIVTAVNFALSKVPRPNLRYAALAEMLAGRASLRGGTAVPTQQSGEPVDCFTDGRNDDALKTISEAVTALRNSKLPDPRRTGNAGSFFKNPVVDAAVAQSLAEKYPGMPVYPAATAATPTPSPEVATHTAVSKLSAGWLIEQAGWKGRSVGRVGIHHAQALIVINLGGATGREIVDFARMVQDDVKAKFGVDLTPEVNVIEN
jgi:UDP-N-acetylmuramate dehydrogenase